MRVYHAGISSSRSRDFIKVPKHLENGLSGHDLGSTHAFRDIKPKNLRQKGHILETYDSPIGFV